MNMKILYLFVFLIAIPAAAGLDISPGQLVYVNCNGTNASIPVSCNMTNQTQQPCQDCGACVVDKELHPSEFYKLKEGTCDLEFSCQDCEDIEIDERSFTMEIYAEKHPQELEIELELTVRDFLDTIIENKRYSPFEINDTSMTRYEYAFECPTEVVIEGVNQRNCNQFFEKYFTEAEPISMQLASLHSDCSDKLAVCQQDLIETSSLASTRQDSYTDCYKDLGIERDKAITATAEINRTEARTRVEYRDYVPGSWVWIAGGGWAAFIIFVVLPLIYTKPGRR